MSLDEDAAADALRLYLAGDVSPEIALARLVLAGLPPEDLAGRVAALPRDDPRAAALSRLHARKRGGLADVRAMLAEARLDHADVPATAGESVARVAAA